MALVFIIFLNPSSFSKPPMKSMNWGFALFNIQFTDSPSIPKSSKLFLSFSIWVELKLRIHFSSLSYMLRASSFFLSFVYHPNNIWYKLGCSIFRSLCFLFLWRMVPSGMLRRVALVKTDVSEELSASFIRVTRIGELGTTLAVTSNRRTVRRNTKLVLVTAGVIPSHRFLLPWSRRR
jgi:hypothetical protein